MNLTPGQWMVCSLLALLVAAAAWFVARTRRRQTAAERMALANERIRQRQAAHARIALLLAEEETAPGVLWADAAPQPLATARP